PERRLASFSKPGDMVAYLRERTAMLGERRDGANASAPLPAFWPPRQVTLEPVAPPVEPAALAREVASLPEEQMLVRDGGRVVCWARAPQIPFVLREIGRLRELTFRSAHEGTGKSID